MNIEEIKKFRSNGNITWTMTTHSYKLYTLNLVTSIKRSGTRGPVCIVCCDEESFLFFRRESIPCISWTSLDKGQKVIAAFGTEEFKKWNKIKIGILRWFCENANALDIQYSLYLDGDIIVRLDPLTNLLTQLQENVHIYFQCDCANTREHISLNEKCSVICSGVIFTRHVSPEQATLYDFNEFLWNQSLCQDQPYIQARLQQTNTPFLTLPRIQYGNGPWQKAGLWRANTWVLLHYNYRIADTKKKAMKKYGHWLIPY